MISFIVLSLIFVFAQNVEGGGDRIIGGVDTSIETIPYQASMWNGTIHFCGCVLISPRWLLTAAHCLPRNFNAGDKVDFSIRIGSSYSDNGGELLEVESAKSHTDYTNFNNDVAVIKLKPFANDHLQFAPLPKCNLKLSGTKKMLTVSGWGVTNKIDNTNILQSVRIPYVKRNECVKLYKDEEDYDVPESVQCCGFNEGGKDACQGDSGGPVTYMGDLIGIISSGFGCALENTPGFFTYILNKSVKDFIKQETGITMCQE